MQLQHKRTDSDSLLGLECVRAVCSQRLEDLRPKVSPCVLQIAGRVGSGWFGDANECARSIPEALRHDACQLSL